MHQIIDASNYTIELSMYQIIDVPYQIFVANYRCIKLSVYRIIELSMYRNIDISNYQYIELSMYHIIDVSKYEMKRAHHCLGGRDVDLYALVAAGDAALKVGRRRARGHRHHVRHLKHVQPHPK
jgi:hypothetical protein